MAQHNVPDRLAAFNDTLRTLKIDAIDAAAAEQLATLATREEIRDLLTRARHEPNARIHLASLLDQARQDLAPPDTVQGAQPPVMRRAFERPTYLGAVPNAAPASAPAAAAQIDDDAPFESAHPTEAPIIDERNRPAPATRVNFHVYGGKGALTIEAAERKTNQGAIQHVVYIDAAPATAPREYAWKDKLMFMLLPAEIPAVLAVLANLTPKTELRNHGEEKDKALMVEHQGGNIFVKLFHAKRMIAVPVTAEDALRWSALLLRQMQRNQFDLDAASAMTLLRAVYAPMKANTGSGQRRAVGA